MKVLILLLLTACLLISGCNQTQNIPTPDPSLYSELVQATAPPEVSTEAAEIPQETALTRPYGYTYQRPDGNRIVAGQGILPTLTPIDIPLEGEPKWVTAVPLAKGVLWGVVLADGHTQAFLLDAGEITPIDSNELTPAIAPIMTVDPQQGLAIFLNPPAADPDGGSPTIYNDSGHIALTNPAGELTLTDGGQALSAPDISLLPDARILFDADGRLLFLTDPTERYPHGVLGDRFEAGSVTLLSTNPVISITQQISVSAPQVIEGIAPLWLDWDEDGNREIIVTVSDADQGAQIQLFSETGELLAQGPAIGRGSRWRHQIAVAPFGPAGELELVAVLTPHIGGTVEFYQWQGDTLEIVARLPGYTSHIIGTNNLDMAMAGDFNGDGRPELLLPTQDRTELGGIQRTTDGAEAIYHVAVDGEVLTNLAGVTMASGETAVGVGTSGNRLRVWQP